MSLTYVLVAHGTIDSLEELPEFLVEIRRGRPASPALIDEMRHRYEQIGHSPLLEHTQRQAAALCELTGRECRVAMRLWKPRFSSVVADLGSNDRVVVIPIAPFSVDVYADAARKELEQLAVERRPQVIAVQPWGAHPRLIDAYVEGIHAALKEHFSTDVPPQAELILTAHSLPRRVISAGDRYAELFSQTANLVAAAVRLPVSFCYQSQGADGTDWLGPTLKETMIACATRGVKNVVVAPIGFFAEHVETLYDLDIEARGQAQELGLRLVRVPTLGCAKGLIEALADAAKKALDEPV